MTTAAAVARALGHHNFTLRGDGVVVMDEPEADPPTAQAIADAQAAIDGETAEADLLAAADARRDGLLEEGYEVGGLHVHLGTAARADLTGMGATAIAVLSGAMAWPAEYAVGWISIENVRIPLPTAADGLALAGAAGTHYAAIAQRNRDVKDAVIAGTVTTAAEVLAAFEDIAAPWEAPA